MPAPRNPAPPASPAREVEVEATDLDDAGAGVAATAAGAVHVRELVPGERAVVAIEHRSPHRAQAWGRVVRRLGPLSGDRTTPACPAFGRCGGCAWQHVAYPAQLVHKRARVERALAGVVAPGAVAAVAPSPAELCYRHKGKYVAGRVAGAAGGALVLGAFAPRSHDLVDTAGCRVVAPLIDALRGQVVAAARTAGLAPWDERARAGALRYVIVRATRRQQALVVLVVRRDAPPPAVAAVARAVAADPRVAGVVRVDNDRADGALLDGDAPGEVLVGAGAVTDTVAGVAVELGAGEFAQVNPDQADALYARVAARVGLATAWSRTSTPASARIAFALASAGARVVAIERHAGAVAAMRRAAAAPARARGSRRAPATPRPWPRSRTSAPSSSTRRARALPLRSSRPSPPAPPAAPPYRELRARVAGRDLRALAGHGFAVASVEPFDRRAGHQPGRDRRDAGAVTRAAAVGTPAARNWPRRPRRPRGSPVRAWFALVLLAGCGHRAVPARAAAARTRAGGRWTLAAASRSRRRPARDRRRRGRRPAGRRRPPPASSHRARWSSAPAGAAPGHGQPGAPARCDVAAARTLVAAHRSTGRRRLRPGGGWPPDRRAGARLRRRAGAGRMGARARARADLPDAPLGPRRRRRGLRSRGPGRAGLAGGGRARHRRSRRHRDPAPRAASSALAASTRRRGPRCARPPTAARPSASSATPPITRRPAPATWRASWPRGRVRLAPATAPTTTAARQRADRR
ncbi:MAG: hypothetical protein HS111_24105 [Kofleriaceae bacterium]|nr:hypothetical protein [Kofleriaceae bacterium]